MRRLDGKTVLWLGASCVCCSWGQTLPVPSIAPAPAWVDLVQNVPYPKPESNQVKEGVRVALIDHQVNVAQKEQYHRVVKDLLSESGVQRSGQLSIQFDPSYQGLTIHSVVIRRGTNTL